MHLQEEIWAKQFIWPSEDFKMMYEEILKLLKEIKEMDISQLLDVIRKLKDDNTDIKECLDLCRCGTVIS